MTDLFDTPDGGPRNILPRDGTVLYYGPIYAPADADGHLRDLLDKIDWRHDQAVIYGKRIVTRRQVAWYADRPFTYTYSKTTKTALPWTPALQQLKTVAETRSNARYNSCLLNLYAEGPIGMAWHSDSETELMQNAPIASLSFGAERRFLFRHKRTRETVSVMLQHGSLLVMKNETQAHWLHSLPKTTRVQTPRISLTFRCIRTPSEPTLVATTRPKPPTR